MAVMFAAELSHDYEIELLFTPSNDINRKFNVYETYVGKHPTNSWWYNWGGYNDIPVINQMQLYIGEHYLVTVYSLEDCCNTPWSIYDEPTAGMIYINVPMHSWLYESALSSYRIVISFTSGPKTDNPSDDIYNDEHWPVRLETPKLTVKLSDVINGLTKYSTFDFTLFNDDGYFDDAEVSNFFNSPTFIKKTWVDNPTPDDFIPIRYGIVESIKLDDKTMHVSCGDMFRTLEEPVSKVVKNIFNDAVENKDEDLSVVYGTIKTKVIKIDTNKYVAGENIISVSQVFDKDNNSTSFTFSGGIITTNTEIESAIVTGNTNNRLGDVIVDIITSKTDITYVASFWDLVETNNYMVNSPRINIEFNGGTVRNAVKEALSSDSVFLIQKNNGRFTLRKWGNTYEIFNIPHWNITKFPSKDFAEAQNNYFSSCSIAYNYDFNDDEHTNVYLYTAKEKQAKRAYNKVVRKAFETYLTNENDCMLLAEQLSNRFSTLRETVKVSIGMDTSEINLLDTIELELNINDRLFSTKNKWIVKEIDPAQDSLTLENI
ncbi:MAG: hypothetical protein LBC17_02125 [Lactobacillaceae bacterium]|jgi:hypothetical protein|nr:hypothetical protein [Lactobacillaceae bacterium]